MADQLTALDLNALEALLPGTKSWARSLPETGGRSRIFTILSAIPHLIQRLTEAEARRDWAIDQSKRASIQWNRDLLRITQLERVSEAARRYREAECRWFEGSLEARVANGNKTNKARAELDTALASVRLTENPTTHKAGQNG